jgi:hypothetical protein
MTSIFGTVACAAYISMAYWPEIFGDHRAFVSGSEYGTLRKGPEELVIARTSQALPNPVFMASHTTNALKFQRLLYG